ncbi:uncharacterized protein LOC144161531 [Haemaphysalis longicornis]
MPKGAAPSTSKHGQRPAGPVLAPATPGTGGDGAALEGDLEWAEPLRPTDHMPDYTCRFCLRSDNQAAMVMPCNCKGLSSHAHANCVAIQIYQNRVYACPMCHYDFNIRWDKQKIEFGLRNAIKAAFPNNLRVHFRAASSAGSSSSCAYRHVWFTSQSFVNWLTDSDNLGDHVMFVVSLLFTLSLVMVLAFAWLQASQTLSAMFWLFALPLGLLLLLQSLTWLGFAFYSLWLYRKAYLLWKVESPPRALRQRLEAQAQ